MIVFSSSLCTTLVAAAEDWTQWSGSGRQGVWNETGILDKFPSDGLKPAWTVKIGSGYSGPIVGGGRVYVTDYVPKPGTKTLEAIERTLCLDETTGEEIWKHQWETHYRRQMFSYATGPRATPVLKDGRIYVMGSTGRILCLNADNGTVAWEYDALEDFGAHVPVWGFSASPLVWNDTALFACGGPDGLLLAFDKVSGKRKWKALPADYDAPYCSPEIFEIGGRTQLVQWSQESLAGFDPETGANLWKVPFQCQSNMGIGRPMQIGNQLLVSCFYNGSMLVDVEANSAKMVWKNGGSGERPNQTRSLHAVITTPIVEGDHFYGTCSYGELRGLKLSDGERIWEDKSATRQGRWGSMFWVKNQDRYFVNNDLGELLIMQFSPDGPKIIDRTKLIEPDTHCGFGSRRFADALVNWVQPAYANRHVIIRNDAEIRRVSLAKTK